MSSVTEGRGARIDDALRNLRILPGFGGFEWFGQQHPAVLGPSDGMPIDMQRKYLVDAVTNCLYENFYCTGVATPYVERTPHDVRSGQGNFVQSILDANRTRISWCGMKLLRVTQSDVVASFGNVAIYTDRNSAFVRLADGRVFPSSIDANDDQKLIMVGGRSWTLNASPGFILLFGQREPQLASAIHRVYWNLQPAGIPEFVAAATHNLNRQQSGFRLKVLADPLSYGRRRDTAVLYLDLRAAKAQEALARIYDEAARHLHDEIPALTYRIAPGLAIAADPGNGESFGMHCSRLIAEACVYADESNSVAPEERLACIERYLAGHGIDVHNPHQLAASDNSYIAKFETLIRRVPRGAAHRPQSHSRPSNDNPWLAAAEQIGRQLVAEAFWERDRCQWVGGEPTGSAQPISRTLPFDLYGGLAGTGHFLAELAMQTNSDEIAATALAAMRQALLSAAADNDGGQDGPYVGPQGVALVAERAGRRLADGNLVEQAAALADRSLVQPIAAEKSPDLLHGRAGEILGLLALAARMSDERFKRRAVEIGERLCDEADRDEASWSWPNRMIDATANLTGLSHGAAGIALALAELWRSTGDPKFLTAANGANAYVDATFSERHANWPDYRTFGSASKDPKWSNFWCHGGAGIILGRLHFGRLDGRRQLIHPFPSAIEALRMFVEACLQRRDANFCLCHGLAGNAEVLWEASSADGPPATWQQNAAATSDACWHAGASAYASLGYWPCGTSADSPSLFLGRAGIGYAYLRRYDPAVPAVLDFDPLQWGRIPGTDFSLASPGKTSGVAK
jgi:hypothetical protein